MSMRLLRLEKSMPCRVLPCCLLEAHLDFCGRGLQAERSSRVKMEVGRKEKHREEFKTARKKVVKWLMKTDEDREKR